MSEYIEANLDGLVGPTHHFAGLSKGNIASLKHKGDIAYPKKAALQGLEKMKLIHEKGIMQLIMPPHPRPHIPWLKKLGFEGDIPTMLKTVYNTFPRFLSMAYSASSMWTANAGTVSHPLDTLDGKMHITIANLNHNSHRSLEATMNHLLFSELFSNANSCIHQPIHSSRDFFDEGDANHCRFSTSNDNEGFHLFVSGYNPFNSDEIRSKRYPERQSQLAQEVIIRQHGLRHRYLLARQHPKAIDAGVFHNDVITLSHQNMAIIHENAFENQQEVIQTIKRHCPFLNYIEVKQTDFTVADAVKSYFFNSQLITIQNGDKHLVLPTECHDHRLVRQFIEDLPNRSLIKQIDFIPLRESMQNGGGPACLRLRIPLHKDWISAIPSCFILTDERYQTIKAFIEQNYPDELHFATLSSYAFYQESLAIFDKISKLFNLPAGYLSILS